VHEHCDGFDNALTEFAIGGSVWLDVSEFEFRNLPEQTAHTDHSNKTTYREVRQLIINIKISYMQCDNACLSLL